MVDPIGRVCPSRDGSTDRRIAIFPLGKTEPASSSRPGRIIAAARGPRDPGCDFPEFAVDFLQRCAGIAVSSRSFLGLSEFAVFLVNVLRRRVVRSGLVPALVALPTHIRSESALRVTPLIASSVGMAALSAKPPQFTYLVP